mgnify:CR=1 FL=1
MKLGVPLQPEHIGLAFKTDRFEQAIFRTARLDAQPLAQSLDGLVMNRNHLAAALLGIQLAQAAAGIPLDVVGVLVVARYSKGVCS